MDLSIKGDRSNVIDLQFKQEKDQNYSSFQMRQFI